MFDGYKRKYNEVNCETTRTLFHCLVRLIVWLLLLIGNRPLFYNSLVLYSIVYDADFLSVVKGVLHP